MRSHRFFAFVAILTAISACQSSRRSLEDPARTEFRSNSTRVLGPYSTWDRLTEGRIGEDLYPTPLATGEGLVFASNRHSEFFKLYLREFSGKRVRRLPHGQLASRDEPSALGVPAPLLAWQSIA